MQVSTVPSVQADADGHTNEACLSVVVHLDLTRLLIDPVL
jgi:hypothetical protein